MTEILLYIFSKLKLFRKISGGLWLRKIDEKNTWSRWYKYKGTHPRDIEDTITILSGRDDYILEDNR